MLIKGIVRLTFIVFGRGIPGTLTVLYLDLCCVFQDILWISKEYQMYACTAYTTDMKVQEKDGACAYFMKLFLHWAGFVKVILTGSVLVLNN